MARVLSILAAFVAVPVIAGCGRSESGSAEPVELTAIELHRAFLDDADGARDSFGDRTLLITGEVAQAQPRFVGTTMQGEVENDPEIYFKTELDTLPTDIKYVVVEGSFDDRDPEVPFALDPRIQIGSTARVECPGSTIRWSDPGLYLSDCTLAISAP